MPRSANTTIYTPTFQSDLAQTRDRLVYWKQILPEDTIRYDSNGTTRKIKFDSAYLADCVKSFRSKAIDQTCFQLANSDNSHGRDFDPERQRAEVVDMATYDELPEDVKASVEGKRGLYAKIKFWDRDAAKVVENNPRLGVSARVRENFLRADGTMVKRAVIHVLGTIDPRVTGMGDWQAADLSYDAGNGNVLDLSEQHYEGVGNTMPNKKADTVTLDHIPSDDEIEAMTDAELDAFLAAGQEALDNDATLGGPDDDDDDDSDDDSDDDDSDDGLDAELGTKPSGPAGPAREPVEASLTSAQRNAIDLANAQAAQANQRANDALRRQAAAEFREYRAELVNAGVRPADVDLCEQVLTRPSDMVIDLSNEGGDDDLNVTKIIKTLLESHKGDVDLAAEQGHSGVYATGDADPDKELLDQWDAEF